MKKAVILHAGLLMAILGASGAAYAGGHWVCPPGGVAFSIGGASSTTSGAACATGGAASSIGVTPSCWWKDDSIEYRGKADAKSAEELINEAKEQATKDAAALEGNELIEADATAGIAADVAQVRAQVFRDRLKQVEAEDKKKGVKHRGSPIPRYSSCNNTGALHCNKTK